MSQIEELRVEISHIDKGIIALIALRQKVVQKIGEYKKEHNLPIIDLERENSLREFHDKVCTEHGISTKLAANIFELLIEESKKVQQNEQ